MDPSAPDPATGSAFAAFVALIARLRAPGGCPWDREQTHASLKPMTIEEAYEVLEAIDEGSDEDLAGELGDLLLQVVFHSQIAAEEGRFTVAEVVARVSEKMVRRHPHVFAQETAHTSGEVLRNWEAIKAAEQQAAGRAPSSSMLDSVSARLPAVMEAYQMTTKVARVGFEWPDVPAVLRKLDEEVQELKEAAGPQGGAPGTDGARVADELGDLLFAAVNVARMLGHDPESVLKAANRKFRRRFRHVEDHLRARGRTPAEATLAEMDALWDEAKARE
ncbi:MAG TPA: nucleoside triphosphate pyrophosphohydrolase [Vicinamibacteria bacterium]|nr:nucleoside triphosphate pyrophosphohydrolase [Vicinamibacteria bacterium]